MKRWLFMIALGQDPGEELAKGEEGRAFLPRLIEAAYRARLAGLTIGPAHYINLSTIERVALKVAGDRLRAEDAIAASEAAAGPVGAGALMAPFDGGESHDRAVLSAFHNELVEAARKKEPA